MNKKILISTAVSILLAAISSSNSFATTNSKECKQADYNPDYTVKNGHSIDSSDLYTRHMSCSGDLIKQNKTHKEKKTNQTIVVFVQTPKPGNPPVIDKTPEPKPTKECKNKNSGKDGTPSECNAGGGQEKHNK